MSAPALSPDLSWVPVHLQMVAATIAPWLRQIGARSPQDARTAEDLLHILNQLAAQLGAPPPPALPENASALDVRAAFADLPPRIEQQDRIEAIQARVDALWELLGGAERGKRPERFAATIALQEIIALAVAARQALASPTSASGQ